jgi:hypothetical protein
MTPVIVLLFVIFASLTKSSVQLSTIYFINKIVIPVHKNITIFFFRNVCPQSVHVGEQKITNKYMYISQSFIKHISHQGHSSYRARFQMH